jgi:hypothetical protein
MVIGSVLESSVINDKEEKGKWDGLRKSRMECDKELPDEVKKIAGDRIVLGFVTGIGLQTLTQTIVMTESEVIFVDPTSSGDKKHEILYSQIECAAFQIQAGAPVFSISTRSGNSKFVLSGIGKGKNEAAFRLFQILKNRISELTDVPIFVFQYTWLTKETWFFYTPPQFTVMAA